MKQTSIKVPEAKRDSRSLHEILVGVIDKYGPRKQEALVKQLNATKGHFSDVVNENGKHWPQDWIDFIVDQYDLEDEVAWYYARRRGMTVRPPRVPSGAERLRRLKYVLARHSGIGSSIQAEADALADDIFADDKDGQ
jgi:hypothetical protein